jgi:hypothetical protein
MTGVASAVMLVAHVVTAVVGFGAVIATGVAARAARRSATAPSTRRYFRPGPNWASLSLLLVPVFGAALEALQKFPDLHQAWPWLALGMWAVAACVGLFVHWPAERRIQALVATGGGGPPDLAGPCQRAIWSSAAMAVLFVGCVGVMVTQPH